MLELGCHLHQPHACSSQCSNRGVYHAARDDTSASNSAVKRDPGQQARFNWMNAASEEDETAIRKVYIPDLIAPIKIVGSPGVVLVVQDN